VKRLVYLDHAFDVLEELSQSEVGVPLSALARSVQISKSGVFRILQTLQARGYVDRTPAGGYRLGYGVLELGLRVPERALVTAAAPVMDMATATTQESTFLSVLDGFSNVTIHTVEPSSQFVRVHLDIGSRTPANCSVSGLVLLAYLDEQQLATVLPARLEKSAAGTIADRRALARELRKIRSQGRAAGVGAWRSDAGGAAAPIFDRTGRVIATLGIAAPTSRLTKERLKTLADYVKTAAGSVSTAMGYSQGDAARHAQHASHRAIRVAGGGVALKSEPPAGLPNGA
jgi:DNA-binding IclR family transcriptional regulator